MSVRMIQVVETELEVRGRGVEGDPVRRVRQYWSLEGHLLAEVDPVGDIAKLKVDQLLARYQFLTDAIPGCSGHGPDCIPQAIAWVRQQLDRPHPATE